GATETAWFTVKFVPEARVTTAFPFTDKEQASIEEEVVKLALKTTFLFLVGKPLLQVLPFQIVVEEQTSGVIARVKTCPPNKAKLMPLIVAVKESFICVTPLCL